MARVFTDGAENSWTGAWTGDAGVSTNARIGGYAYATGSTMYRAFQSISEGYLRVAVMPGASHHTARIEWLDNGTSLGFLNRNTSTYGWDLYIGGSLVVSGTPNTHPSGWCVIELHIKIADSGGMIELKINGITQTGYTGDTKPGSSTTFNKIGVYGGMGVSYYDDLALNDTSGTSHNSWTGDAHIYGLVPNGNGDSSQWVGNDGNSTDNYLLVDEIGPNGADYVDSATVGDKDLYTIANLPTLPAGANIKAVVVETVAVELTAEGDTIKLGVKSGGVEEWSSGISLGISYRSQQAIFPLNPSTGLPWTEAEVNAMQAGIQV